MPIVSFPSAAVEFIIGPQLALGSPENVFPYFDTTQKGKGEFHASRFPATPPPSTESSDKYIGDQYYDQALCQYALYYRSGDPLHLANANKIADSWWLFSPFNSGQTAPEDSFSPRNSSLGGLMLRALHGRPEMWDWIVRYARFQFDAWVKRNINEPEFVNGIRDSSYMLHYAIWLAKVLPDSVPNAATLRAGFLADAEAGTSNYFLRLQQPDGSFRWGDDYYTDADGGRLRGIMQPFMVGLLLHALIDVHRGTANTTLKANIKTGVLKCLDHLYDGGPFMKRNAGIPGSPIRWRAFNYFYHGGTTVNPTKYATGDYTGVNAGNVYDVQGARQGTSTIIHAVGWAFKETGDQKYALMGGEYLDSIVGFKEDQVSNNIAGDDPKGYNQHFRAGGRYLAWRFGSGVVVTPTVQPSPDGTKAVTITDSQGGVWTLGPNKETLRNGNRMGNGSASVYKYLNSTVYALSGDNNWYKWGTSWVSVGPTEPGISPPPPPPPPVEPTAPTVKKVAWPSGETRQNEVIAAQWAQRYRFKRHLSGSYAEFEKVV